MNTPRQGSGPAVLLAAMPAIGHVAPLAHVARTLVDHGCTVRFLAGSAFEALVTATGAEFVALPADADEAGAAMRLAAAGTRARTPLARLRADLAAIFVDAIPAQIRAIDTAVARSPADVVIADPMFLGAFDRSMYDPSLRVEIFAYGVMPIPHSGDGAPPFGLGLRPGRGALGRARDRILTRVIQRSVFGPVQTAAIAALASTGGRAPEGFFLDWSRSADRYFQTGPAGLEYQRSAQARPYEFVGAVPAPTGASALPSWWPRDAADRTVVFVTQGTVQNDRFDALLEPTIDALAGSGALVIATTGSSEARYVRGHSHPDVTVVPFVPYGDVLPHVDLMITNGGFGGVQQALAHGVPLVIAGRTEDKAEVAARVAASGAGVSLGTDTPSARAIRRAVARVAREPGYRAAAERLAADSGSGGLDLVVEAVHSAAARRRAARIRS